MRIGKYIENGIGEFIGMNYENGFVFNGEFGPDRNPLYGEILNPNGDQIYYGQITGYIFDYFDEYIKTGKIKQRSKKY
ncbi:MAG: hypothetical protein GZ094_21220 [Mariniphaga sp.]|nr:hypothetical protein [Mariniphaga sp.]